MTEVSPFQDKGHRFSILQSESFFPDLLYDLMLRNKVTAYSKFGGKCDRYHLITLSLCACQPTIVNSGKFIISVFFSFNSPFRKQLIITYHQLIILTATDLPQMCRLSFLIALPLYAFPSQWMNGLFPYSIMNSSSMCCLDFYFVFFFSSK